MGYSIYWQQILPVSQAIWDTFIERAMHLIKRSRTGKVDLENKRANPPQTNVIQFEGAEGQSHETFYIVKDPVKEPWQEDSTVGWGSCKTNRKPYTTDVFICLILMFDLGMLKGFSADDMNEQYPEALEYVKRHYALKRSYEKLMKMANNEDEEGTPVSPVPQQPPRKKRTAKTMGMNISGNKKNKSKKRSGSRRRRKMSFFGNK